MSQSSSGSARERARSGKPSRDLPLAPDFGSRPGSRARHTRGVRREQPKAGALLSLGRARVLVWATPRGQTVPYEVSKAVPAPLQARCKSAPLCPGETSGGVPGWIDPLAKPLGTCPYDYSSRGDCISDRNVEALVAALFSPAEVQRVSNYLGALGFKIREEEFPSDALDGARILNAHARIGDSHEVRVLPAPGVGDIVLVRDMSSSPR